MKLSDFIYRYSVENNDKDGLCRIRVFVNNRYELIVIITDPGLLNPSTSVTNCIEHIIASLLKKGIVNENAKFIEQFEPTSFTGNDFDTVEIGSNGKPHWSKISKSDLCEVLGSDINELESLISNNERLLDEIEKLRYEINPNLDFISNEEPKIALRRIDIWSKRTSKQDLQELIEQNSGEQKIQNFLKKDLSIFAELYSKPQDDYICFSEFPINDGFVDFAVFTGVSRMDVILVEIKGAEFNLLNKGHYNKFNSKVEIARDQIIKRLEYINKNYNEFRGSVHAIREKVEAGNSIYNSFIGPCNHLEVDSEKDINIQFVIIGGRTVNDKVESNKRHELENSHSFPIKIESWDTWLRKIRRD